MFLDGVLDGIVFRRSANYTGTIQKSRTGDPDWEDLSKPPVPVRSAHYGAKDLASVRLAWIQTFSSIPGEARVLLSSPRTPSATETGSQCEIETLLSAQGAASTGYIAEKFAPHSSVREFLEKQPKKTPLLQLANESKERFQNL